MTYMIRLIDEETGNEIILEANVPANPELRREVKQKLAKWWEAQFDELLIDQMGADQEEKT